MAELKRGNAITVAFYNQMAGTDVETIDEIPRPALELLAGLTYNAMARALIYRDLRAGRTGPQCMIRYKVTRWQVREVRRLYKL